MSRIEVGVMVLVLLVCAVFGGYKLGDHSGYSAGYSSGYAKGAANAAVLTSEIDTLKQRTSEQVNLNSCIDKADSTVSQAVSKVIGLTTAEFNAVLDTKKQAIEECQARYPVK